MEWFVLRLEPVHPKSSACDSRPTSISRATVPQSSASNFRLALFQRGTVTRPVNLAQASQSRLGEMKQGGETSGVALQWSGRNSMAPVSGCSWWCPICITRIEHLRFEQGYPHKCKHPLNPTKLYRGTVTRPVNLAQASQSRLGEMKQGGETSGVALQWSGRNSMAPVSGCSWWCPICITRIEHLRFEQGYPHKCKHPLNPTKLYVSG
ncbi:hypothetical protein DEO72_LG2g4197 [Vigna unguiculata]|uniref:Uncharacterized protein n=1 Tax=Vigna unguiculata TaxID=3917 RepID=A0A4D6L5S7_VIGUN|nr:hypothetical protein DEO72_LG2g4197 [Vigna unguiculata]